MFTFYYDLPYRFFLEVRNFILYTTIQLTFIRMNIFLCDDFTQLSRVGDNILYTLSVAFKASVAVMVEKIFYNIFTETIMLIEIMQQINNLPFAS